MSTRSLFVRLFVVQFFSWGAMFALWVYAVPVIAIAIGGAAAGSRSFVDAAQIAGACFTGYALLAVMLAFALPIAVARAGFARVHSGALAVGAVGFATLELTRSPMIFVPGFAAIGVAWCAMTNIPYAIVGSAVASARTAHLMRVFALSTVVPQAVATFALTAIVRIWFADALPDVMLIGAASMAIAAVLALVLLDARYAPPA